MKYWLIKFAPFRYSWEDCLRNGRFEIYSVRSPQARNNLNAMKSGDSVLFYHSQEGNCVMGKMKVIEEAHQDPTTTEERWVSVTFEPTESLQHSVSLNAIKANPNLANIGLVKQPRLSVMAITESEFNTIMIMAQTQKQNK
ncbi:conserved hypothetical protein [uncultured Desulfobacterium sp.]|uniref:EVE domain-containing protein n=1 Tax=uncultured Desulfobacterium sp. TaxID=201089 RepID=A0A445MXF8_9BACT|nr:conserved hypothetical protein [uncultured Desulfobacterium sp.]